VGADDVAGVVVIGFECGVGCPAFCC